MTKTFKIGDRVSWNSEAGRVSGTVIRVHTHNIDHKGYTHHASSDCQIASNRAPFSLARMTLRRGANVSPLTEPRPAARSPT
jgi:hypothetical protein